MQRYEETIAYKQSNGVIRGNRRTTPLKLRNCKNLDKLENSVVKVLLSYITKGERSITAEDIAIELNYKVQYIKQIFAILNRNGYMTQKYRYHMNGTNRAHMFYGDASGWSANYYTILNKIKNYEKG